MENGITYLCGILKCINLQNRFTDVENKLMSTKGEVRRRGKLGDWGIHTTMYKIGEGDGTHASALAWKIPWTEEPGGLQSMGSQRVGHD